MILPELTFAKDPGLSPVPLKPQREIGTPIDIYAFYMEWQNGAINSLKDNLSKIDVLIPEWLALQGTGLLELNPYTSSRTLSLNAAVLISSQPLSVKGVSLVRGSSALSSA